MNSRNSTLTVYQLAKKADLCVRSHDTAGCSPGASYFKVNCLPLFALPSLPPGIQSRDREAVLQDQKGAMGGMVMSNSQNAEECGHSTRCLSAITGLVSTNQVVQYFTSKQTVTSHQGQCTSRRSLCFKAECLPGVDSSLRSSVRAIF